MNTYCECCQNQPATCQLAYDYNKQKFSLCEGCHKNVTAYSLLPSEWFHLMAKHGKYADYINENYYFTNGVSILPKIKRDMQETSKLPTLTDVNQNLTKLIECMSFPFISVDEASQQAALKQFQVAEILHQLDTLLKTTTLPHVWDSCYKICGILIKIGHLNAVAAWLKQHWQNRSLIAFDALVKVSALCFPIDEVFELTTQVILNHRHYAKTLSFFPTEKVLPWLETHVDQPYSFWGEVAAKLFLSWNTVQRWISQGRPLSLVAIAALKAMCTSNDPDTKLYHPASVESMTEVLNQYLLTDPTSTVRQSVALITSKWDQCMKHNFQQKTETLPSSSDPFVGKLEKIKNIESYHIKKFIKTNDTTELVTKFGGQPTWLETPQWPLSKSIGTPMKFVGQIVINKNLFAHTNATIAYLFITDDKEHFIEGTYNPESGENAVILQPGDNHFVNTRHLLTGPTVSESSFLIETELTPEPDYIPLQALSVLLNKKEKAAYLKQIEGNKMGGLPHFIQVEEYPGNQKKWHLLLQLSMDSVPFDVNFGDNGTGYLFLSSEGKCARFLWQSY